MVTVFLILFIYLSLAEFPFEKELEVLLVAYLWLELWPLAHMHYSSDSKDKKHWQLFKSNVSLPGIILQWFQKKGSCFKELLTGVIWAFPPFQIRSTEEHYSSQPALLLKSLNKSVSYIQKWWCFFLYIGFLKDLWLEFVVFILCGYKE